MVLSRAGLWSVQHPRFGWCLGSIGLHLDYSSILAERAIDASDSRGQRTHKRVPTRGGKEPVSTGLRRISGSIPSPAAAWFLVPQPSPAATSPGASHGAVPRSRV